MREALPGADEPFDSDEDFASQLSMSTELLTIACLLLEELRDWEHYPWHEGNEHVKVLEAEMAETNEAYFNGDITMEEMADRALARSRKQLNTVRLLRKRRKKNPGL